MRSVALSAVLLASPVFADDLREACFDRPGRLTPPCIVDAGHAAVEIGVADFTHDRSAAAVDDQLTLADTTLRLGLTSRLEAVVAWSPYNRVRTRDRATGITTTAHGVGDLLLGVKQSLRAPDGKSFSIALQPFVTAPTAKDMIGAGGWTQGLIVPVSIDLPHGLALGLSPEVDRLPNAEGRGHHLSYTAIAGLSRQFGALTPGIEIAATRDDEQGNRSTEATADIFVAWQPATAVQFDAGTYIGLNRATPDVEFIVGVSRRF